MSTYWEKEQERQTAIAEYQSAIQAIAPELLAACTPERKRAGRMDGYNMPPELSQKIHAIYEQYGEKYSAGSQDRWAHGLGMTGTSEFLGGYSIGYYGRNADKFYLYKFTEDQHNDMLQALGRAAAELETEAEQ